MKAMILAAGFGTRLGSLTQTRPKALIEVGGKAMIEYVIEQLKTVGVRSIVINLHHLGEQIEEYCRERKMFDIEIIFSREKEILGTGGGIKFAEQYLSDAETFFIYNADVYCDLKLDRLAATHRREGNLATLVVTKKDSSRVLLFSAQNHLVGWRNRSTADTRQVIPCADPQELGFCGIHLVSRRIFDYLRQFTGSFGIFEPYIRAVESREKIGALVLDREYWLDMGKPQELEELRAKLKGN